MNKYFIMESHSVYMELFACDVTFNHKYLVVITFEN